MALFSLVLSLSVTTTLVPVVAVPVTFPTKPPVAVIVPVAVKLSPTVTSDVV